MSAWGALRNRPNASEPNSTLIPLLVRVQCPLLFRVVRYLPATDDSATVCGNLRAGVAQASREETAGVC